jgi:protein O-GlcNAc transferase
VSEFLLRTARRLRESGQLAEAARLYGEILRTSPHQFEALHALGLLYYGSRRFEEAVRLLSEAVRCNPQSAEAWFGLGCALQRLNRLDEAIDSYDRAIVLKPGYADALVNRGVTLMALRRPQDALASLDAALASDPNSVNAHINRGTALQGLERNEEAISEFDKALALAPNSADALVNRGAALFVLKRREEAVTDYEAAYARAPGIPYLLGNLIHYRLHTCDWRHYDDDLAVSAKAVREGKRAILPFVHVTISRSPAEQLQCARIAIAADAPPSPAPLWRGEKYAHDKIRVAYVSADYREHAVARLVAGVFEEHDRSRFQTVALAITPSDGSAMRARMEKAFDRFIDIERRNDAEAAALLNSMEIDIALDLTGFTTGSRTGIFAQRPAPIQANFLGYPGTMGATYFDYIIADRIVVPENHDTFYPEKVVTLPGAYQCNDRKREIAAHTPTRSQAGLPETGVVFCCFNNNNKIQPGTFSIWMRILAQVPDSVLWLLQDNEAVARNLKREARARGIDPQRLIFAPRALPAEHLARQRLADLFLDTLPYGAHTTASDALWVGLPVLTLLGTTFAGRVGASLLHAAGLPELVTHSAEEYETLALKLARDSAALAALKSKLVQNRDTCALFDTKRFTRNLEAAYHQMWERQQRGEAPHVFALSETAP